MNQMIQLLMWEFPAELAYAAWLPNSLSNRVQLLKRQSSGFVLIPIPCNAFRLVQLLEMVIQSFAWCYALSQQVNRESLFKNKIEHDEY